MDFVLLFVAWAFAQAPQPSHFVIDDSVAVEAPKVGFIEPTGMVAQAVQVPPPKFYNLLRWIQMAGPMEEPTEAYNRKEHFGGWIRPEKKNCLNTRAFVLIRESKVAVSFKEPRNCAVDQGEWDDPYTGNTVYDAAELQIDHFVPLKNAYQTGAWQWGEADRCQYANFLADPAHLVPVDGHENMSKGHHGPDEYLPPNEAFRCEYVKRWLAIKMLWRLQMSQEEAMGVAMTLRDHQCDPTYLQIPEATHLQLQTAKQDFLPACANKQSP